MNVYSPRYIVMNREKPGLFLARDNSVQPFHFNRGTGLVQMRVFRSAVDAIQAADTIFPDGWRIDMALETRVEMNWP